MTPGLHGVTFSEGDVRCRRRQGKGLIELVLAEEAVVVVVVNRCHPSFPLSLICQEAGNSSVCVREGIHGQGLSVCPLTAAW